MNDSQKGEAIAYEDRGYRRCVGIFLLNASNKVFVARRIDNDADAWQMPQGGIDDNEDVENACFREMEEEIGTRNAEIIRPLDEWLDYDIPHDLADELWSGRYRGQMQKWFALRFTGSDDEIDIETEDPEFSEWKWVDPAEIVDLAVGFKRKLYGDVLDGFFDLIE